jgi:hypothetical protein
VRALRPDPVGDAVVMKCTQSTAGQAAELELVAASTSVTVTVSAASWTSTCVSTTAQPSDLDYSLWAPSSAA